MTNKIIETIKAKYKKYPTYNLYYGYYRKTIKENDIEYTYNHYDCFLGDATNLRDCTKLKKLTGENKDKIYTIDPKNMELSKYKSNDSYKLKEINNIYFIDGSSKPAVYTSKLVDSRDGRVYNKKISINYINYIIQRGNQLYRQHVKDDAIEEQNEKMEYDALINQEFGKQ